MCADAMHLPQRLESSASFYDCFRPPSRSSMTSVSEACGSKSWHLRVHRGRADPILRLVSIHHARQVWMVDGKKNLNFSLDLLALLHSFSPIQRQGMDWDSGT